MYEMDLEFEQIVEHLLNGGKVTRDVWKDKRHYGLIQDGLLQIHKSGESDKTLHPWIISEADLSGTDWTEL